MVNSKLRINLFATLSVVVLLSIIFFLSYTNAANAVVRNAVTNTAIITVDDTNTGTFNITVNVTEGNKAGGSTNVTAVIVNFSMNGRYLNLTDGTENNSISTNPSTFTVVNTNWSVNWTNASDSFFNASGGANIRYFWFGVTPNGAVPVKGANISVMLLRNNNSNLYNATNLTSVYNITLNVNDSFTVNYVGKSNASGVNLSQNYIPLHLNITGNQTTISLRVSLHNSTGEIYRNISVGGAVVNGSGIQYNFSNFTDGTDLPNGVYTLEVIVNNSNGDMNNTANRTYRLDTAAPSVTLVQNNGSSLTTKTQVTLDITASDSLTGINTTCESDSSTATITGGSGSQTLTESDLQCGTRYTYVVTCTDTAGNRGSSSSYGAATLACSGGDGGSSGGGSGGSDSDDGGDNDSSSSDSSEDSSDTGDSVADDSAAGESSESVDLRSGSSGASLAVNEELTVLVQEGASHKIKVTEVGLTSVTLVIESTPQTFTINVGDSVVVDVDDDGSNDLKVTLSSIENGEANLTVEPLFVQQEEGSSKTKIIWFVVVVLVIIAAVLWFVMSKRKN